MLSPRTGRTAAIALASALMLASPEAFAWGQQAHAAIDRAAIEALPDDGPIFLRDYVDYIAVSATLPDKWRSATEPFAKIEEDPNHGWFREEFAFLKPIPRSRYEFLIALYRENQRIKGDNPEAAKRMNVRWTGTLPYAVMEQYGQLVAEMRQLRAARAANAPEDAQFLERNCAFQVIRLGHYIGDGAQPLHDSINSDGWRGANPKGYTTDRKIHGRFESDYVAAIGLTAEDVARHITPAKPISGDAFEAVLAYLDRAGDDMEQVYKLDKRGALTNPEDREARALVYARTGAGAGMLRDMIERAWVESARPVPEKIVDPLDAANPAYNPETGSAPAPRDAL